MTALKTMIDYRFCLRNGKRASKYAHVYFFSFCKYKKSWTAHKRGSFCKTFATEREAGEFVARQLGATLIAVTMPDWDESMRSVPQADGVDAVIENPEPKPKPRLATCRPRKLVVRFVKRPDTGERVHSGRDLVSGVGEQNAKGYDEMLMRGAL